MQVSLRLAVLAAIALLAPTLAAQPTVPRLGVEIRETDHYSTYRGFYSSITYRVGTSRSWRGTVDGRRVGEVAFYRTAGADHLASYAISHRRKGWVTVGLGLAVMGAGITAGVIDANNTPDDDRYHEGTDLGLAALIGVTSGFAITVMGSRRIRSNATSSRQALETLDAYYGQNR